MNRRQIPWARLAPWAVCLGALVVLVVGQAISISGGDLGVPSPPFSLAWRPAIDHDVWISLLASAGGLACGPALLRQRLSRGLPTAAALYGFSLVAGLAINLAHSGSRGWWAMFSTGPRGSYEGHFEYLLGLPLLEHGGLGHFLKHFAALLPMATTHIKGNPPGPLIAIHALGIHTAPQLAALCVIVGSLCAPLAYGIGRELGGETRGRLAGALCALSPAVVLFGTSSVDYAFAGVGTLAVWLLVHRGRGWLLAGAVVAAFGTFLSYLLFAMPVLAALVVLSRGGWRSAAGRRPALEVLLACVAAIVALNGALALAYGYDPFAALRATEGFYRHGYLHVRTYSFWLFGSPAAWGMMLGLPLVWLSVRALTEGDPAAVAVWLVVLVASVLGTTKAETERIWLPFVPLVCVAAAAALPPRRLRWLLSFLLLQSLAIEVLFFTNW